MVKGWSGGDGPPKDWDGGPVLYRNGVIANVSFSARWLKGFHEAADDIIAYTPIPEPDLLEAIEKQARQFSDLTGIGWENTAPEYQEQYRNAAAAFLHKTRPLDASGVWG